MGKILIGYENHADTATLSGGSWTIPLTTLQDPRPGRRARSSNDALSSTIIRADLGAAKEMRLAALTHTNLSAAALYRLTWFSDAFSTAVANTGWLSIPGYPTDDPDFLGASIWHVFATAVTARWWQIEIDDQNNVAGYVEAGRLFLPTAWVPTYNFAPDSNSDGLEPNSPRQDALGGYGYFNRRTPKRFLRAQWPVLPETEAPVLRRLRRLCGVNRQVVVIPDPDDSANFHERNFIATMRETPAIALFAAPYLSTSFDFTEVVP